MPAEIINQGLVCELSAVGLTDHDIMDGVYATFQVAQKTNLEVVPGIEFNTDWEGVEIHILDYFLEF